MEPLLAGGQRGISTLLVRKRVRFSEIELYPCVYLTIGLCVGWTPSTFVSSRSDRAKANAARPEDFMDEDDLQELKESKSLVNTDEQTDLSGIFGGGAQSQVGQGDADEYVLFLLL